MEDKVKKIMADIFGIDIVDITEKSSPDTISEWDSLKQMNLVLALEEEFEIIFSDEQITEMLSYKLICSVLREHNVEN